MIGFAVVGALMALFVLFAPLIALAIMTENRSTPARRREASTGRVRAGGASPNTSQRQRAQRLIQKGRDADLQNFVAAGNRAWALQQLAIPNAIELDHQGMLEDLSDAYDMGDLNDPFNF